MYKQTIGWSFFALLVSSSIVSTVSYPSSSSGFTPIRGSDAPSPHQYENGQRAERKLAEKSNSIKKVDLDDLDDVSTNQIGDSTGGGGFSWSHLLGTSNLVPSMTSLVMNMIFSPGAAVGPNKSEGLDDTGVAPSPWANLLSVGLKILTAILGGGGAPQGDGIDKVDNGASSPLQGVLSAVLGAVVGGGKDPQQVQMMAKQAGEFITIVMNLLDALKTSFSHRSLTARNLGKKDSLSDAAVASISMMKGYVRSMGTEDSKCMAKYMCQANTECSGDIGQSSIFCHLGSYAASFILDRSTPSTTFDVLYEASRRGRSGDNCQQAYLECNEV